MPPLALGGPRKEPLRHFRRHPHHPLVWCHPWTDGPLGSCTTESKHSGWIQHGVRWQWCKPIIVNHELSPAAWAFALSSQLAFLFPLLDLISLPSRITFLKHKSGSVLKASYHTWNEIQSFHWAQKVTIDLSFPVTILAYTLEATMPDIPMVHSLAASKSLIKHLPFRAATSLLKYDYFLSLLFHFF